MPTSRDSLVPRRPRLRAMRKRNLATDSRAPKPNVARAHILVVDDNSDARLIFEEALTSEGYAVTVAKNGLEALSLLRTVPVDLIVIDLQMPELGGRPAIRAIRALGGRFARLPIVVVSAFAPPALPDVQAVLAKPVSLDTLAERLATILEGR